MLKNYFKIALRNLWRNRGYSALNIGGLAIGMSAGFLILLYVAFEISFDRFHENTDSIYRLVTDIKTPSDQFKVPLIDWNILSELDSEFPEIQSAVRVMSTELELQYENREYKESYALAVDSGFFKMFSYTLVKGDPETLLDKPLSLVLSESAAKKYFGDEDPIGKAIGIGDGENMAKVTGVMHDMPENTYLRGDVILSISSFTEVINPLIEESWANFENHGFVMLNDQANTETLVAKIETYNDKAHGKEMEESKLNLVYKLEPLADVYLYSNRGQSAHITNVYVFSVVAFFILLIAAINFINLTTARSVERAKEVGIRKVIGAQRGHLAFQFLGESIVICQFAFILSIVFTAVALPYFNELAGKVVAASILSNPAYLPGLFLISVVIALVAGAYPALVLSSFKPVTVLKGKFAHGSMGSLLRKGLVVSQFSISIALIIGTMVIYNQTTFMQSQDLGFKKDQLLIIQTNGKKDTEKLKDKLTSIPAILSLSTSTTVPGGGGEQQTALSKLENNQGQDLSLVMERYLVDEHFIPQFEISLLAGRNFSDQFLSDSTHSMIINEKATKLLGFSNPNEAVGKRFDQWGQQGEIIGVVKDFHISSLQEEIQPLSLLMNTSYYRLINIKIAANSFNETLAQIESYWNAYFPGVAFEYFFLDEFFDRQYKAEERFGKLILSFSLLAIFISCLGLFGLGSYSTLQRRREIGIRKVLGASVTGIVNLLTIDFLKLVVLSILVASPLAWFVMNKWLEDFAYRVDIELWVFAVAGISALAIALLTISFQAIKAAILNPVKSIRTE